jgi:hypothetical protein
MMGAMTATTVMGATTVATIDDCSFRGMGQGLVKGPGGSPIQTKE